jgi:guanylate kinase
MPFVRSSVAFIKNLTGRGGAVRLVMEQKGVRSCFSVPCTSRSKSSGERDGGDFGPSGRT